MSQLRTIPLAIAAVGMTVDGREITEKDIDDIVATYNPKMYGARINLDHEGEWSGWAAKALHAVELTGGMLGDVLEVSTGENSEGVKVLYAVLSPNASFVTLNQADQAVYFSIEINQNFMKTEKTYLTGLAVTDFPASTFTDRIKFSSKESGKSADDKDVSLLTVESGDQKKPKTNIFKTLFNFNKEDDEMKQDDLVAALKTALGEPLAQFTQALTENTAVIDKFSGDSNSDSPKAEGDNAEQSQEFSGDDNGVSPKNKTSKFDNEFEDKFTKLEKKFNGLMEKFNKAVKDPAPSTTDGDEDPDGTDEFSVGEAML